MNKIVYHALVACFWLFSTHLLLAQNLAINEFMASNGSTIVDEFGEFDDWVEIYNPTSQPIDIGGYYLTDDLTELNQWQIPTTDPATTTIPADGFLLLWFDKQAEQGVLHTDIKLGSSGEDLAIVAPNGTTIIDSYTFGAQLTDVSEGRSPDGIGNFAFYTNPSPDAPNGTPDPIPAAAPEASQVAGLYSGSTTVALSSPTPNATIYYTTDGTAPTTNSTVYSTPLTISTTTNLRAITTAPAFSESDVSTFSYLIDVSHTFPIISFTSNPDDFFGQANGLFPNFERDIETPIHVEMFEPSGTLAFSQVMEVEIQGTGSAVLPQKSLGMKAKGSLGSSTIDYPVFPSRGFTQYRSLTVRNSGQDWNITQFRDAMASSLVDDISDVAGMIKMPNLNLQAYRPGVVYINGEYWGIQNLRERMDKRYLKVHFDLDDDEIDFLDEENEVRDGDAIAWNSLQQFLQNNSLSSTANFNTVADQVELDEYMDYLIFNVFIDNADWPSNNNRRWREKVPTGKWRWMVKDLDFSFGLFIAPGGFNTSDFTQNSLGRLLTISQSWPNVEWSTRLFRRLTENDQWRTDFINRMADQLNIFYNSDRIINRIDEFRTTYLPERQQHADRWSSGFVNWDPNIQKMRDFAQGRPNAVRGHFVSEFTDINGTAEVTINVQPANAGRVNFSTLTLGQPSLPFSGTYFTGIDIPLEAVANSGFEFVGWSVSGLGSNAITSIELTGNQTITAIFQPSNGSQNQTITFPAITDKLTTDAPFNVTATASSNLPVSFSILSGPATINGNTITLNGTAGTVVVAANQGGNAQFNPAPQVTRSFNVTASGLQDQTINFPAITDKLTTDAPFNVTATASSNLPVSFSILSGPATINGNTITLNGTVGTVVVAANQGGNAQFNPAPQVTRSFNITAPGLQDQTINFSAIANKLTTDVPFQINATASSNLPVQFSIVSGPATINGNTVTLGGVTGTVVVVANQGGNAQFNPAPPVTRSFSVTENSNPNPPTGYCGSRGAAPWFEWIGNVTFRTISNDTNKDLYGDYTNLATNASVGSSYTISVRPTFSWTQHDEYIRVWIDYNRDGDFDDANEVAFEDVYTAAASGSTPVPVTGMIQIPGNANIGATRMRVSMQRGAYADPCENFQQGEVEDYLVILEESAGGSITANCPNNITVTAPSGATGRTVTWNAPTASTSCGIDPSVTIQQTAGLTSGAFFPVGAITVEFLFTDQCGNSSTCSFVVTVQPAVSTTLTIDCPNNITVTAPSGANSAIVSWAAATADSDCTTGQVTVGQTSGATPGSAFPIGITTISYEANDGCGNTETCSFTITVQEGNTGGPMPTGYCTGSSAAPWFFWISNVNFGTIDNDSDKRRTNDFTNQSTVVNQGSGYSISLQTTYSWTHFDAYYRVWIDFNRDGDFDDAGEEAFSAISPAGANGSTPPPVVGNIQIPANASLGTTRMRIAMAKDAFLPDACTQVAMGEVEDYAIDIQAGSLGININERSEIELDRTEDLNTKEFLVYPNPTTDHLLIVAKQFAGQAGIVRLRDIQGRVVMQQKIGLIQAHPMRIALPTLPMGSYFISIKTMGQQRVGQMILIK